MRHAPALVPPLLAALASTGGAQAVGQEPGPTLHARVFADFNYAASERPVAEGFRSGQLVGHVVAGLSERITFFTEVSLSAQASAYGIEAERAILRYDHADWLRLSAGRFHTPLSYWNTAFHHGQWLTTAASRPEMIRGGGTLLPIHFVGALAEGTVLDRAVGVSYAVGVGNGRGANLARAGDAGDANGSRALTASTTVRLPRATGLQLGLAYYADRLTPDATTDVDERTVSAFLARDHDATELIVEWARVAHDPRAAGPTTHSDAFYAQVGYRLPGPASAFKPYVRVDRVSVPASDAAFGTLRMNHDGRLAGVRWDVGSQAALKVEYRAERIERGPRLGTIAAQLSFTFPVGGGAAPHHPPVAGAPAGHDEHGAAR